MIGDRRNRRENADEYGGGKAFIIYTTKCADMTHPGPSTFTGFTFK